MQSWVCFVTGSCYCVELWSTVSALGICLSVCLSVHLSVYRELYCIKKLFIMVGVAPVEVNPSPLGTKAAHLLTSQQLCDACGFNIHCLWLLLSVDLHSHLTIQ